jgi:hypothetical protein
LQDTLNGNSFVKDYTRLSDFDEERRRFVLYLLSAGVLAAVPGCASGPAVYQTMTTPAEMPEGSSVFSYAGEFKVNGAPANLTTGVGPGDVVETGENSEAIYVVDKDAFLLRAKSRMQIATSASSSYRLDQGKVLSVLASRRTSITTPSAVIGVRGTGVYMEVEPDLTYVCLCYGRANLATADDPSIAEDLESQHHDAPKYILGDPMAANRIQPAPFKNHDDQELLLIETLVGRSTPYPVPAGIRRTRGRYI